MIHKHTKIVCTIGPSSHTFERLVELVEAGMNVCRLNFSHGTHDDHAELIRLIRKASKATGQPLAILQDLQGPKIRVGDLPKEGVMLKTGKDIIFTTGKAKLPEKIPVTYPLLHKDVRPGQQILLDDGLLSVEVLKVRGQDVLCKVTQGGPLTSHKGLNLPETKTSISAISDKDRDDLRFGVEQGVDWVALSFVRSAEDLRELRRLIQRFERETGVTPDAPLKIIAKVEKPEAVEAMEEIVAETDAIMVARGDLGIEIAASKVPLVQKRLIQACLEAAKPVIVATQMLDSMIRNPRATRAEVSDVANAVIDETDATMLSGETATGAFPVEAVTTMSSTICEVEQALLDSGEAHLHVTASTQEAMTNISVLLSRARNAKAILVATLSGQAARLVSRERPNVPIYAASPSDRVVRQLALSRGVIPVHIPACRKMGDLIEKSCAAVLKDGLVKPGDEIILVAGEPLGESGNVNLVEVRKL
ncbi:pyruvate kinase [Patescibacteria group bacterium]|nr:pyruvate kinase [Patescibacteria group bacterium]